VRLSARICRILGAPPPESYTYELFLDEHGQKISKSKGNGLTVDEWLRYAPQPSLGQFMYQAPQRAKRLHFDVIPRAVDEYLANAAKLATQTEDERRTNPAWHIHGGRLPNDAASPVSFGMLLNLASVANAETPEILWGFLQRYSPGASPETMPFLDKLVHHAIAYYQDLVRPAKRYRVPTDAERAALADLAETLRGMEPAADAETLQTEVFAVGKRHDFPELRAWFACLYQVLLGQEEGPRFGGFIALYGVAETVALIEAALLRQPEPA
jgi:lysyl-tRNA synthetase class 1